MGMSNRVCHFKLVLLGDAAVGKSCLVVRFVRDEFFEFQEPTIGAAFLTQTVQLDESTVKFEIWDTAGQERFRSLAPMYYRGASAAIVVYDQTNALTFERAQAWEREVMQTSTNPNIVIALAANKADLSDKRQVAFEKAETFAESEGLLLMETSAMSGKNVARLFESIAEHLPEEPFIPEQSRGLQVSTATGTMANPVSKPPQKSCCSR